MKLSLKPIGGPIMLLQDFQKTTRKKYNYEWQIKVQYMEVTVFMKKV